MSDAAASFVVGVKLGRVLAKIINHASHSGTFEASYGDLLFSIVPSGSLTADNVKVCCDNCKKIGPGGRTIKDVDRKAAEDGWFCDDENGQKRMLCPNCW